MQLSTPARTRRGSGWAVPAAAAAVLGCGAAARSATAPTAPSPPAAAAADSVVFFDDFGGRALDRSRWTVRVTGADHGTVNNEQQAYVDDEGGGAPDATLRVVGGAEAAGAAGGALRLAAVSRPGYAARDGRAYDFVSSRLDTRGRVEFTYGTAAARMKLPAGAGLWPAFWLLGTGDWPATGEIDVMENVGDSAWTSAALHGPGYSGNTPLVKRAAFPAGSDATGWHVYAVDWARDAIAFRVDDREVYRVPRAEVERYGRWAYDTPKFLILNLAVGGGYPQAVNGAGAPHPGLPERTAAQIRAGQGVALVDWVRVTRR